MKIKGRESYSLSISVARHSLQHPQNRNQHGLLGLGQNGVFARRRVITAVARAEPEHLGDDNADQEVHKGRKLSSNEDVVSEHQQKASQLKKRIFFGLGIGLSVGVVVLAGGWVFAAAVAAAVFIGAREYFELVRSCGITEGMTPPPQYRGNPRFAQLSSTMFGLFYCGYLPFCSLVGIGATWPILLGGQAHWTVGLVATRISFSSIIAADTYAFVGGKAFGRTPLTSVSPKKMWEGTIVGLGGCIATSVVLSRIFCWPKSLLSTIAFVLLNFFASVFGDLTESMIKRDAGVKDSGSLIPGHGNAFQPMITLVLNNITPLKIAMACRSYDRMYSCMFTGALAYSFVKTFLPIER
ncbi:unnamed protein product [Malus baccata var. baccata]